VLEKCSLLDFADQRKSKRILATESSEQKIRVEGRRFSEQRLRSVCAVKDDAMEPATSAARMEIEQQEQSARVLSPQASQRQQQQQQPRASNDGLPAPPQPNRLQRPTSHRRRKKQCVPIFQLFRAPILCLFQSDILPHLFIFLFVACTFQIRCIDAMGAFGERWNRRP